MWTTKQGMLPWKQLARDAHYKMLGGFFWLFFGGLFLIFADLNLLINVSNVCCQALMENDN